MSASIPTVDELVNTVRGRITDPARKAVAAALVIDLAHVHTLALAGSPSAQRELAHVTAQAKQLAATEATIVSSAFEDWAMRVTTALVSVAIGAA